MQLPGIVHLLRSTRRLTALVVLLLSLQLFGNLYEELVSNARALAHPGGQPAVESSTPAARCSSTCPGCLSVSGWPSF